MRIITICFAVAGLVGCGDDDKDPIDWDPECEGTADTHSCLSFEVGTSQHVRDNKVGDLTGTLFWALFNEGDVDLATGARTGDPVRFGTVSVDLSTADRTHAIHVVNLEPGSYHPMMQLDDDGSGGPNDGDVVTTPQAAVDSAAGVHQSYNVTLGLICAGGICNP
jgi:hypothetical protein